MLTAATLGMLAYALAVMVWSLLDLVWWSRLEVWADVATGLVAALLLPASVFVRARIPGGLPLAIAGLLGLQAVNLHNSMHLHGSIQVVIEGARGVFSLALVLLAWLGARRERDGNDRGDCQNQEARSK
jgi:hypothetical protein